MLSYLMSALMMLLLMDYAPNTYVPRLVKFYELTLCLSFLAVVLFVVDRCIDVYLAHCQPYGWITRCLALGSARMIFGLEDPLVINSGFPQMLRFDGI